MKKKKVNHYEETKLLKEVACLAYCEKLADQDESKYKLNFNRDKLIKGYMSIYYVEKNR